MEIGEKLYVNTEGPHKVGFLDRSTVQDEAPQNKFIILLDEGETIDDGEHFMCEFEPASVPHHLAEKESADHYYLKLNRGNGY